MGQYLDYSLCPVVALPKATVTLVASVLQAFGVRPPRCSASVLYGSLIFPFKFSGLLVVSG